VRVFETCGDWLVDFEKLFVKLNHECFVDMSVLVLLLVYRARDVTGVLLEGIIERCNPDFLAIILRRVFYPGVFRKVELFCLLIHNIN